MKIQARVVAALLVCSSALVSAQSSPPQNPPARPTFRSEIEVTTLDVTVVDTSGRPLTGLGPGDFTVRVDGVVRKVARAEWVALSRPSATTPRAPQPENYSTNEGSTGGRL